MPHWSRGRGIVIPGCAALGLAGAGGWVTASPLQAPAGIAIDSPDQSRTMSLHIDATDLPRHLLRADLTMPMSSEVRADGGEVSLWYPKWVPGTHGPRGPIENLAGITIRDDDGAEITWTRNPGDVYNIIADVPAGAGELHIEILYITDQPTTNSRGVDSFGSEMIGVLNFNTVVLYRSDLRVDETAVVCTLDLPAAWKFASALPVESSVQGDVHSIEFKPVTLEALVDSPLIAAEHLKTYDLTEGLPEADSWIPPHYLHVASENGEAVEVHETLRERLTGMVVQASRLFGSHPYDEYHVLVCATSELPGNGLEHLRSSFNVVGLRSFMSETSMDGWASYLLPHEYVHAWCGKYRRPEGMWTGDYHSDQDPELIWVYEGLTQYLGIVIAVRCGLVEEAKGRWDIFNTMRWARLTQGRQWRPLADTSRSSHILRAGSRFWSSLRRNQDYYSEGELIWMEADAMIRNSTDGTKSLDDFCQSFFAWDSAHPLVKTHDRSDAIEVLNDLLAHDWERFFADRVDATQDEFALGLVEQLGYTWQYSNEPPEAPRGESWHGGGVDARESIGARFSSNGNVQDILLDSPADKAGLGPTMQVEGVNGYVWSADRMIEAIAQSAVRGTIDLMFVSGDRFLHRTIEYDGGPRYPKLVRADDKADRFGEILTPRESR